MQFFQKKQFDIKILIVLFLSAILVLAILIFKALFYSSPLYLGLPTSSTLLAVEWNANTSGQDFAALSRKMGLPNAVKFLELEKIATEAFQTINFVSSHQARKVFSLQIVDSQVVPVLIVKFKNKQYANAYLSFPGFSHFKKGNTIFISPSAQALTNLQTKHSLQLVSSPDLQEAFRNLPKQNILDFYLNHKLLTNDLITGLFSVTEDLNQLVSVTVASLRENNFGLVLSTYSTPVEGVSFGYTRKKYQAELANSILADQQFFLGGTNANPRILGLVKNLPNFKQDQNAIANQIFSLLNTYNLSSNALKVVTNIFSDEYGFSLNGTNDYSFYFKASSDDINRSISAELEKLAAFFNPRTISYLLEDGQVGRQLVPSEELQARILSPTITAYPLFELKTNLFWNRANNTEFSYFSTAPNPENQLAISAKKLSQDNFFQNSSQLLLPIADDLLYLRKDFLHKLLAENLDLKSTPNTMTATNFFIDGFQTVTIFQW